MKKIILFCFIAIIIFSSLISAQIAKDIQAEINNKLMDLNSKQLYIDGLE